MKVSKVSVNSWHYRLRDYINKKSYVNNWFKNNAFEIDSCHYWRDITHYFAIQIPSLVVIGAALGGMALAMITSMIYFFTFGISDTIKFSESVTDDFLVGLGVSLWFVTLIISLIIAVNQLGKLKFLNKNIDFEFDFIRRSIDAAKNKYCFSIEYVDANGECIPLEAQDDDDKARPFGFRMGKVSYTKRNPMLV